MPQDPIPRRETLLVASTLAATVAFGTAAAPTGANAQAAASTVDTRIGKIDLLMGLPANAEVERRIYDEMDFQRACQGYIWALPIVSMNEWNATACRPTMRSSSRLPPKSRQLLRTARQ